MNAIQIDQVTKVFGKVAAVDGLSLAVPTGSIYGFLGPNGAGKTTTIRMIMDIIRPDSGSIAVLGQATPGRMKSRIGYMPEERGLYRKMRVRDVLAYFAGLKGVARTEIPARVADWLQRVELSETAGKRVEELSRGMHQKLQFAVTAINDPDLLILDEPFSGLDPLNTDLLKDMIRQMKAAGKTVIFSTHAMHEAERLCDAIVLINQGRVVLEGSLNQIKNAHAAHAVNLEIEQGELPSQLAGVEHIERKDGQVHLTLSQEADTQAVLQHLLQHVRVRSFEVCRPSLHEIFVTEVGHHHASNH